MSPFAASLASGTLHIVGGARCGLEQRDGGWRNAPRLLRPVPGPGRSSAPIPTSIVSAQSPAIVCSQRSTGAPVRGRGMKTTLLGCGFGALAALAATVAHGQAPPPPPPLGPPPVPAGNPQTAAKIQLGKALFWEEQLSITGTVACGTCHRSFGGGGDPRTALAGASSINPGRDGLIGTGDDLHASAGVPAHGEDGLYQSVASFGIGTQVGTRRASSAVNAAYPPLLFWDGRAGGTFVDPLTAQVLIQQGGALENQALGPLVNTVEMAFTGATVNTIGNRLTSIRPLALAVNVPDSLNDWIAGRDYPALFADAFGSGTITAARIAMAIAAYERTLNGTQTPLDAERGGTPSLTQAERAGQQVFVANECAACHAGALISDNQFHYIGVRPVDDDLGRFVQTNNPQDRGAFRTPSLRNVELRAPYMSSGRFMTLEQVVDFYDRGGDFTAPNKDPRVRPRNLTPQQKANLVAFLKRPMTDPRVAAETGPFERPTLFTESDRIPRIVGTAQAGSGGVTPQIGALEPPLLGNSNFTVSVADALGGAGATLVISRSDPGLQAAVPPGDFSSQTIMLGGAGSGAGTGSVNVDLGNDPALVGQMLFGRFYIADAGGVNGLAITQAFQITVFGNNDFVFRARFE
ncbi:cytochrome-c peroxidase [Tahibacter sp.]|uniref:cytochrome-c peroxidase n=1 Tax=Tahibacter sp. TaxID=2056211 RepID=UPI002D7F181B|nr:cytochrome c peroxidase [Tahibacter sp.]